MPVAKRLLRDRFSVVGAVLVVVGAAVVVAPLAVSLLLLLVTRNVGLENGCLDIILVEKGDEEVSDNDGIGSTNDTTGVVCCINDNTINMELHIFRWRYIIVNIIQSSGKLSLYDSS